MLSIMGKEMTLEKLSDRDDTQVVNVPPGIDKITIIDILRHYV